VRRTYLIECHSCESRNPVRGVRCPHLTQNWRYIPFQPGFKHSVTWRVYNWRFVVTILSVLTFFVSTLFADTTWVAGTVSGVWGREGNPYLVTDTLTIPHDSTLQIMPGVQIYFQNQQIRRTPINVLGRLRAIGEEDDSVYFYSPMAGFGGIDNHSTHGTEIRLEYCVIDSIGDNIESSYGYSVFRHSRILGNIEIHLQYEADTVAFCSLDESSVDMSYGGPGVFQHNRGGSINAFWQQMEPIFDNQGDWINMDECFPIEIFNNKVRGCFISRTDIYLHHNQIMAFFNALQCSLVVEYNEIGNLESLESNQVNIYTCLSLFQENRINAEVYCDGFTYLTFYKNIIISAGDGIDASGYGNCLIQKNTIAFVDFGVSVAYAPSPQIVDNIFQGNGFGDHGVYAMLTTSPNISYNDFFQVTSPTYGCELDTGNIFLDPQFRGRYPFDYRLQASSPCIDAGDPSSRLDPDSTRADMGAYYYDQRIDHPPALCSPLESNVQLGTEFRYVARATDDYGPLQFGFWNLPPWLQIESLDWVADSVAVSGIVPIEQVNFTFGVWAEDGLSQRDSQEVLVLVSQFTILQGEVSGVLTAAESPYLVVENIYVPAGDSLWIEPGVQMRFHKDETPWEPNLTVRGTLHAVGTAEDPILFVPEFQTSWYTAYWGGIWCRGPTADTSIIEYACISQAGWAIEVDSQACVLVKHSRINKEGIRVLNNSWAGIDSCVLYPSIGGIYVNDASADISNCYSICPDTNQDDMHVRFYSDSYGSVEGCTFLNGRSCGFDNSSRVNFIANKIANFSLGVDIINGSSGIVANNIFSNGGGLILGVADSVLVANNTFHHVSPGITIDFSVNQIHVKNNVFLDNSLAIYARWTVLSSISYNDFFGNDTNFVNCVPDSTNIYLDPILQDTVNFRLLLGSPCIDAGDPDPFFNDVDSTRNDIGCWGGPWGESYPYVPVFSHQPKPIPTEFALLPPYPNPFNNVLVIPFTLPIQKEVMITIYNILGQKVQEFTFPSLSPGAHRVVWNSGSCASGLYIIQLISGGKELKQKVILLK
jgi:hypothetical protein